MGAHVEICVRCPHTSLFLLPPHVVQILGMPVLYELGQQLSVSCSACRGAQHLSQGYSCSSPNTWANKLQELLGQPWQEEDLIPSHIKQVEISVYLKETLFLVECVSILEDQKPLMLLMVMWHKQGKDCLQETYARL